MLTIVKGAKISHYGGSGVTLTDETDVSSLGLQKALQHLQSHYPNDIEGEFEESTDKPVKKENKAKVSKDTEPDV